MSKMQTILICLATILSVSFATVVSADDNAVQIYEVMVIFGDPDYPYQDTITIFGENFQNKDFVTEVMLGEYPPLVVVNSSNFEIVALCPPNMDGDAVCPSGEFRLLLRTGTSNKDSAKFDLSIQQRPGGGGLSNRSVVTVYSPVDSANYKNVSVPCPVGKIVLAGGNRIRYEPGTGNVGQAVVNSCPDISTESWIVNAKEIVPTSNNWQLQGYAICASSE